MVLRKAKEREPNQMGVEKHEDGHGLTLEREANKPWRSYVMECDALVYWHVKEALYL